MNRRDSLASWLRHHKLVNDLDYDLMALHFDMEGGMADDQPGLVWMSQERFLHSALLRYVAVRGSEVALDRDRSARARHAIAEIARWNDGLAQRAWDLVLRPVEPTLDGTRRAVEETMGFVSTDLGIPAATRSDATRSWAEGVRRMREAAVLAGLAESDTWYVPHPGPVQTGSGWYQDVLSTLEPLQPLAPGPTD